ncbi:MAG: hypothetical protein IJJ71_00950 [Treponema sp.]|uniref:hypothetical protein n=1 Tax=Treponema sp. TaxID=166 RepID=UPI0025E8D048|nr:hypothetical protein [Treponema sp.]MBQ9622122.1 hypothetical protein [Treponema sp.]MBR0494727.1 hypothetical protein [Treponema sp.]
MKDEIVLLPNPNQLILLKDLQKEICRTISGFVPVYPICLKCGELCAVTDKITKADVGKVFLDKGRIFLSVGLEINGNAAEGRIELCEIDEENLTKEAQESFSAEAILSQEEIPFKKLSPFRIVEMNSEEYENGVHWEITAEKWGKVK